MAATKMLFDRVLYYLSPSLPENTRVQVASILDNNGAQPVDIERATHVISNTIHFEGSHKLKTRVPCITVFWVERSMELGAMQDPLYYSADRSKLFSGVTAAAADALELGKTIGTLRWFCCVEKSGVRLSPLDNLLHYPSRQSPIEGFSSHEITITNYQGEAREYLKKLISLMGATFTPNMSGRNTAVVAAHKTGTKTAKAEEWSLPVV
ncbi:hypothetical protein M422DRAFT_192001, partial [Sphaerobolus stellatus SS14]